VRTPLSVSAKAKVPVAPGQSTICPLLLIPSNSVKAGLGTFNVEQAEPVRYGGAGIVESGVVRDDAGRSGHHHEAEYAQYEWSFSRIREDRSSWCIQVGRIEIIAGS